VLVGQWEHLVELEHQEALREGDVFGIDSKVFDEI